MIYSVKTYKETFHPTKSIRTVTRMIKSGLLPSTHILVEGLGREKVINVITNYERAEYYIDKAIEFNNLGVRTLCDATKFCVENDLKLSLFVKIVGI